MQEKYIDETKQGEAFAILEKPENSKKLFLESYGCQMNFSDSEIVASILNEQGYNTTLNVKKRILFCSTPVPSVKKRSRLFATVCQLLKILKKISPILPLVFSAAWRSAWKPNFWKKNNW